jgi:hypothetical protein
MTVAGAFNINSTSVDAWAAMLGGMKNLPAIPGIGGTGSVAEAVFPRTLWQNAAALVSPTGDGPDSYAGFRKLDDGQIRTLAGEIVKQVRLRGPFVSLAHFVNRTLVPASQDAVKGMGQSGPLQAAIDRANLNEFTNVSSTPDPDPSKPDGVADIPTDDDGTVITDSPGSTGTRYFYADGKSTETPSALQRSTGIPGWLTQADVLQKIGPILTPRSDTFVIRACGEALDTNGNVTVRAWCEATVLRLPEYLDPQESAETNPSALTRDLNKQFGRKFQVTSFRWLSSDEI